MSTYPTKLAEAFAKETLKQFYQTSVIDAIANRNYEGAIKGVGSLLNVLTFAKVKLKTFTGANMSADSLSESSTQLNVNQQKAYYFQIPSLAKFQSYIKDPEGTVLEQCGNELQETIDAFGLSLYAKVGAGNRVGTNYTTGTVTVDVTTGAVTGSGTTFTAAMVGRGFKATGHTSWYRIKSYSSTTAIVIEDDLDDIASAYTGGAIGGGATYVIEANTPVALTAATIYGQIAALKQKLDAAKRPMQDRALVVNSTVAAMLVQSTSLVTPVDASYEDVVKRGLLGSILGFTVYQSEQIAGDNTNGWRILAVHKSWLTFAEAYTETGIEDLLGNFGKAYKGLTVYGAKVADVNRISAAELFCTA